MLRRAALLALLATLALTSVPIAQAGAPVGAAVNGFNPHLRLPGTRVPLRAGTSARRLRPILAPTSTTSSLIGGGSPALVATADIQVTYNGFSQAAQDAFESAVNVWESMIVSSQVIHVDASWTSLGASSGILGQAGPESFYLGGDNRAYPAALAEAKCACELEAGAEISAEFNSAFSAWYLGTDGIAPSNKYDFYTVVLHELGHGLGFLSSFWVSGGLGYWGLSDGINNYALWFDENQRSAVTGGSAMISYANGSSALKTQLTDSTVYLDGSNVVAYLGGRARLYAPSTWQGGSSNSHLDESTFPAGTQHALMTPQLSNGEVIHDPGPLTLAIFRDMGWATSGTPSEPGDVTAPTVGAPIAALTAPQVLSATALVHVTWPEATDDSGIAGYELQRKKGSGAWVAVSLGTPTSTAADVAVTPGSSYQFRVRATDAANNVGAWATGAISVLSIIQEKAGAVGLTGSWRRRAMSGSSGGYVRYAGAAGRAATLTFSGQSVALVSTLAPARGMAEIWLDGSLVTTLDLYSPGTTKQAVVWASDSSLGAGTHTLQVRVTGTRNPSATKNRIDVDAFLVWP